jgi:hypothetical protein
MWNKRREPNTDDEATVPPLNEKKSLFLLFNPSWKPVKRALFCKKKKKQGKKRKEGQFGQSWLSRNYRRQNKIMKKDKFRVKRRLLMSKKKKREKTSVFS